jgi:hypothetical protein
LQVFFRHRTAYLQILAQWWAVLMSLCDTRYFARNTCKCLLTYVSLSSCIFARNTCIYCVGFCSGLCADFCAGFCAVASPSALSHRSRVAVASPLHRSIASQPHRVAGDLPTLLELHLPVVYPTRCTRTEEVEPQPWALCEAMMRTHVKVMVERL